MKLTTKFYAKLLSTEKQEEYHCNLASSLHIAIYKPLFDSLELRENGLLLGKNALINVKISKLNLPVKLGSFRDCFIHEDLKAFFKDDEEVFLLNYNDLELFDNYKVIKPTRIEQTELMETISLKFPKKYQKFCIPGQIYFGIGYDNNQILKFELIGFGDKFEISKKRDGIDSISYFVAPDKAYNVIVERLEAGKLSEPREVINRIKDEENELKDKYSKKILQFYKSRGVMPSHIELVSNVIGIPLGYEKQVLQYLFGPIKLNLDTITAEEQRILERNSRKILNFVSKKRKQIKSGEEIWQPLISEIIFELRMKVNELRLAFEYFNIPYKDFTIKPEENAKIDRLSKTIINIAQKNKRIPSLEEIIEKGMTLDEAKKALKVSDEILKKVFPLWEKELEIPHLLFPVDEMVSEYLDKAKEIGALPQIQNGSISEESLEDQITKAKFQRKTESPIIFDGNSELFLKKSRSMIEKEISVSKVKENIFSEADNFSGDIIYAYLDKKKQVNFSIQVSVIGNTIDEKGKADLTIKSNDLSVAERFFNILKDRLEELATEVTKDHYLSDSQNILQMVNGFGKGKNWTNIEEITIRLNMSAERAQRILDYMEENKIVKKIERASTGVRYYFPGLTQ